MNAAQTGRLVYVVGPSGAGKDSVIDWLRQQLPQDARVHFARRTITRAVQPGGEQHDSVDVAAFMRLRESGAFAMHWEANALHYGIARAELAARCDGRTVIVNGSRAYLPQAARLFPELVVAHITADAQTLRRRLLARERKRRRWSMRACGGRSTSNCRRASRPSRSATTRHSRTQARNCSRH